MSTKSVGHAGSWLVRLGSLVGGRQRRRWMPQCSRRAGAVYPTEPSLTHLISSYPAGRGASFTPGEQGSQPAARVYLPSRTPSAIERWRRQFDRRRPAGPSVPLRPRGTETVAQGPQAVGCHYRISKLRSFLVALASNSLGGQPPLRSAGDLPWPLKPACLVNIDFIARFPNSIIASIELS